jgi:hypothetical protein
MPPWTWKGALGAYRAGKEPLVGDAFLARWGGEPWAPCEDDRAAAAKLHTEITSRITLQRLGYLDGVEKTALDSVYTIFQKTRDICHQHPAASHFNAVAWAVLNCHVRPFTAKWHRASQAGALAALDAIDEFRAELNDLQPVLQRFDDLLLHIRDGCEPPRPLEEPAGSPGRIADEMGSALRWGIPERTGGIDAAQRINEAEKAAIEARRAHYGFRVGAADAVGLALSGGGIRSATFSLGVLIALARRGLLPQFDYLSTVSGGGYLGSFLSAFLNAPRDADIGLCPDQLPFRRREGEAAALRHLRHHSKYMATRSSGERVSIVSAQLYGMVLNALAVVLPVVAVAAAERLIRGWPLLDGGLVPATRFVTGLLAVGAALALLVLRSKRKAWWPAADRMVAFPAVTLAALLAWRGLDLVHARLQGVAWTELSWLVVAGGAVLLAVSALAGTAGRSLGRAGLVLVALSAVAAPHFVVGIYLAAYQWAAGPPVAPLGVGPVPRVMLQLIVAVVGWVIYFVLFNVNVTSPHRHYRGKLAQAYLIQPKGGADVAAFDSAVRVRLSELCDKRRAPYHLVNCALNVPSSANSAMQGRLTDFFLFSPRFCGSPVLGYKPTTEWEAADAHLDLGTAMAISGAAAAPQMGLGTMTRLRFWLALLNVRLGHWVRRPETTAKRHGGVPGLEFLFREMLGRMNEKRPWVHVSDGGHIENLGVYELLRRRCKYIVAVDGEQDPQMTFQGLTRLQRLAAIDLGVHIDINLDDLRLNSQGLSRSHFRFCRIHYPSAGRGSPVEYGYLLYVKLSLTGNEGEFIRRYRHDEPAFPHHSTADQFFTEEQFEAYRSLGEHTGDNLFLRAIVGDMADSQSVDMDAWFRALGENLLEPVRDPASPAASLAAST